jgi:hypothetical protein
VELWAPRGRMQCAGVELGEWRERLCGGRAEVEDQKTKKKEYS